MRRAAAAVVSRRWMASAKPKYADPRVAALARKHGGKEPKSTEKGTSMKGPVPPRAGSLSALQPAMPHSSESDEGTSSRFPGLAHRYIGGFDPQTDAETWDEQVEASFEGGESAGFEKPPFKKILIANRGEIACRIIRTARAMGIRTVAVHSEADSASLHVQLADEAVCLGPAPSAESYLKIDTVVEACKMTGAEAVHPGYGFLSENTQFAAALEKAGVAFIGPGAEAIAAMGDKIESKKLAQKAGVNVIPGRLAEIHDLDEVVDIAREIGYPIMIKASAGGGGKGMRVAWSDADAKEGFRLAKQEAKAAFGDDRILIEKFVDEPRHVEIQVLADGQGNTIYVNERECSIQRRNQKVLEESPSPFMTPAKRKEMGQQACQLAEAVNYASAGTVEFLMDSKRNFYFLEMNTRLQVEHPVTEKVTGIDLVEQMIRVAAGRKLSIKQSDVGINGWAMEARVYAEDPARNFLPSIGELTRYKEPLRDDPDVRCDSGIRSGDQVSMFYDPLICKLVAWGPNRAASISKLADALDRYEIRGVNHNIPFLRACMDNERYKSGKITTKFIDEEFPNGFKGVPMSDADTTDLIAISAVQHWMRELREYNVSLMIHDVKTDVRRFTSPEEGAELVVRVAKQAPAEGEDPFEEVSVHVVPVEATQLQDLMLEATRASVTPEQQSFIDSLSSGNIGQTFYAVQLEWDDGRSEELVVDLDDWAVGENLLEAACIGMSGSSRFRPRVLQVDRANFDGRYTMVYKGTNFGVQVLNTETAELHHLLPEPVAEDSSKLLRSPMPGHLLSVAVQAGDAVVLGQEICVVEAMKLQNVLRAERDGVVKSISVLAGNDVDVDDLIVEFE